MCSWQCSMSVSVSPYRQLADVSDALSKQSTNLTKANSATPMAHVDMSRSAFHMLLIDLKSMLDLAEKQFPNTIKF